MKKAPIGIFFALATLLIGIFSQAYANDNNHIVMSSDFNLRAAQPMGVVVDTLNPENHYSLVCSVDADSQEVKVKMEWGWYKPLTIAAGESGTIDIDANTNAILYELTSRQATGNCTLYQK